VSHVSSLLNCHGTRLIPSERFCRRLLPNQSPVLSFIAGMPAEVKFSGTSNLVERLMSGFATRCKFTCQAICVNLGFTTANMRLAQINTKAHADNLADRLIIYT